MNKAAKAILAAVGLYAGLMLTIGLAAKFLVSGDRVSQILASYGSRLPVEVTAGEGTFDLWQWFLFRPAVTVQQISVSNPQGFSERPLFEARGVSAQVALLSLFSDRIDIRSFRLAEPRLLVERDQGGRTNVETVLDALAGDASPPSDPSGDPAAGGMALAIDGLFLDSGTIEFQGAGESDPSIRLHDINLALTNFSAERTCQIVLDGLWFDGQSSRLHFDGNAGPFSAESIPSGGNFAIDLAPAEIPEPLRREFFGDLLAAPEDARFSLTTALEGDLLGSLQGEGNLAVAALRIGQDSGSRLPLDGEVPLDLTLRKPLTDPSFTMRTEGASLQLGEGRWDGEADVEYAQSQLRGGSRGAISGVQVSEMLGAFTSAKDAMFGVAEIPSYEIRFAGKDATEMSDSLNGQAQIQLRDGRIALFDLLSTIEGKARKLLTGESPAEGDTNFVRFASDLTVGNRRMTFSSLALENATALISGQGYATFDQELSFDLAAVVSGALAESVTRLTGGTSQSSVQIPVRVRGTVQSPQVQPDFGRLAKQQVVEKAKGLLDSIFRKASPPAQ